MNKAKLVLPQLTSVILIAFAVSTFFPACTTKTTTDKKTETAQWRGINRDGIYNETGLLNVWNENGPELLWSYVGIGKGYASPAIADNKLFVNGEQDSSSFLFAFDLLGNLLWKAPNGREFMGDGFSATYPGSRSTPTVVDNLVYTTSGKGRIACFETSTGTERWAVDIVNELGGLYSYFGYSESVLIDNDKLFCFPGGNKNNTVALNRFTGEIEWSVKAMQDTFSYCSPILVKLAERKVVVTTSRHYLYTLNSETGEVLDSYLIDHYKYDGEHCNSPLYVNGNIYFVGNEENDGAIKLELTQNGKLNALWQNKTIKNNFNGYVKIDNHLFTMVKGNWLKALDDETGEVTDSVKAATGSIIYADNKFICYGMNGDVSLITFNNNQFENKSTFKVQQGSGHHFAHPVLADGVLYIRHGDTLLAYKI
ncbi:PQQ-binding-like beta-propeller repeat protein [Prolixibacteraceae bacterium Z1-6]|uniref:PQQ-binding-like beta-propeller repeat protein n=1 Tax=Draconibacterium aestuarii TaxID=2998507 RepID=A0A9X3F5Q8_9BACT|nr:PQQ-binding-like beta-propeller repeat protein [Prolixibacteraceae bacterium Z1-6]